MQTEYNSYKNKILFFVLLLGAMMMIIVGYFSYNSYQVKMDDKFIDLHNTVENIIASEEHRIVALYKSRLKKNLKSYGVLDAIMANDREKLFNLIKPRYDELINENENFEVMHFHDKNNHSFLRMHKPNKYGDDLTAIRDIVKDTNKKYTEHWGFEKGIYGYFYRVVSPIIENGEHYGSVEFGLKLDYFTNNLKRLLPHTKFGLMFLTPKDEYSLIIDENNFFSTILKNLELSKQYNIVKEEGKSYIVSSDIYIKDYKGKDAIKIVLASDITAYKKELINQFLFLFFVGGFTYVVSFLIVKMGFKKYIVSIEKQSKKLKQYTNIIDEHVIVSSTDLEGIITYASDAFCKISGYTKTELIGKSHNLIRHKDTPKKVFKNMWDTIVQEKTWKGEVKNKKKDGSEYWVSASISPIYDDKNNIKGYTAVREDITNRKKVEEMSQKDKLTQLYNRAKIDEVLEAEIDRAQRYDTVFSVILMDIDYFKEVNDIFGHQVGDKVLIQMAEILTKCIRKTDVAARWGGEEFMIICPNTDQVGVNALSEKLRKEMEKSDFYKVGKKTGSFGISQYIKGESEESIIKRCDDALYMAKKNGRNMVVVK